MSSFRSSDILEETPILCEQPFCTSRACVRKQWKPTSLKPYFLACTLLWALALLGCTSFLHFRDYKDGAILFADSGKALSNEQNFLVRYLPIMLLVLYGMLVSVVDLDIKRLEPWYQLSKPKPTTRGPPPLLCRYDTDFVLTVATRALWHRYSIWISSSDMLTACRHWAVFGSSCLLVLATIVVPTIQNAMFTVRTRTQSRIVSTYGPQQLVSLETQSTTMTSNFLNSAYSRCWLRQSMPGFTTDDYVLAPFAQGDLGAVARDTTITGQTIRYWTELQCWAPSAIVIDHRLNSSTFSDGRGCTAPNMLRGDVGGLLNPNGTYEARYFGGQNPYRSNTSWPTYCDQFPHLLLITWRFARQGGSAPDYSAGGDATAMFCEPEYFMENVKATLVASNSSVLSYVATGPAQKLPDDLFNRTNFENIITNGRSPYVGDPGGYDDASVFNVSIADAASIAQGGRLLNANVLSEQGHYQSNAMAGFALGVSQLPASDFLNSDVLQQSYAKAHRLLFALAMTHNFGNVSSGVQEAKIVSTSDSVHLIHSFTIATESLLVLVAALCVSLLWIMPQRALSLVENPDSFAAIMSLCRSPEVQKVFSRASGASESAIEDTLNGKDFLLSDDAEDGPLLRQASTTIDEVQKQPGQQASAYRSPPTPRHLIENSWLVSIPIIMLLASSVAMLLVLSSMSVQQTGLGLPSSSEFVQQFLLSFTPTAFATLLGAYLMLVTRSHSYLQLFQDLYDGDASAESTLLVNYTSLPAPLLFVKAFGARHYLLGLLSFSALLSNVLTVTMASMFLQKEALAFIELEVPAMYQPNVINKELMGYRVGQTDHNLDAIYATAANLSSETSLPPWATTSYGYLPLNIPPVTTDKLTEYEFENTGYGAELDCVDLSSPPPGIDASLDFGYQGTRFRLWANYTRSEGVKTSCWFQHHYFDEYGFGEINGELTTTPSALEISNVMSAVNTSSIDDSRFCGNLTVKGWVRGHLLEPTATQDSKSTSNFVYNATILSCTSRMKMQQSRIRTSADGRIISAMDLGPVKYDLPPTVNLSSTLKTAIRATSGYYSITKWHDDPFALDWPNHVFEKMLNSTDLVDASQPVPSFATASKLVEETFTRLFALHVTFDHARMLPLNVSVKGVSAWDTSAYPNEPPGPYTVPAKAYSPERRIFISRPNFMISIAILTFDFIVLLVFRLRLRKPFLPRMPFTIASQIAFFSGSHVIDDVVKAGGNLKQLDKRGYRYGYGRYVGKDGWAHVGIEREPFVTRLYDEGPDRKGRAKQGWWKRMWMWPWSKEEQKPASLEMSGFEFQALPRQDGKKSDASVTVEEKDNNWI